MGASPVVTAHGTGRHVCPNADNFTRRTGAPLPAEAPGCSLQERSHRSVYIRARREPRESTVEQLSIHARVPFAVQVSSDDGTNAPEHPPRGRADLWIRDPPSAPVTFFGPLCHTSISVASILRGAHQSVGRMQKDYLYFTARLVTFAISLFFFAISIDAGQVPNTIGFGALGGAIATTAILFIVHKQQLRCSAA